MRTRDEHSKETQDNLSAGGISVAAMVLIIVLLMSFGLKSMIPPPPPKKTFYVELDAEVGGGGGGGMDAPTPQKVKSTAAPNYATQNAQQAPSVAHSEKTSTTTPQPAQPKVDQSAVYKGGKGGSGSGGGKGPGIGTGTGWGNGPGEGGGSGGAYGEGTGYRGMTSRPSLVINEEHGTVCIEVFIEEDGTVSKAVLVPAKSSITKSSIQEACLQKAKQIKYNKGKKERRYVVFGTEN